VKEKLVGLDKDVAICLGGCEDKKPKKMKAPDKIMMDLLQKVIMFNCNAC